MIRFLDGTAAGKQLLVRRAPLYLRVCLTAAGALDALDQISDQPRPMETVHVYRRVGAAGSVHVDYTRGRGRGRDRSAWYALAEYRLCAVQPDRATVDDTGLWQDWCRGQQAADKAAREG